ncbi:MAG: thiamine pyrophosphate-dependent enzyme [Promethearchaeota archaeon]
MSGNEAFARGVFEAGIIFAANYPGTPISEVGDYLHYLSETSKDFIFDYSVNEKVALESCIGVSWAGLRAIAMFKHLGMNVAADPLHSFPYSGVNGGMVILNGGDPGILSSTNAQDNRFYSLHAHIPILKPSTIQECKDFIIEAIHLSENFKMPIIINTTSRICHGYGIVTFGKIKSPKTTGFFKKDPDRFINTLGRALANQKNYFNVISRLEREKKIHQKLNFIKEFPPELKNSSHHQDESIGIITSGACYGYVLDVCYKLGITPPILKLGLIYPLNGEIILDFIEKFQLQKLLIVEELEPFLQSLIELKCWKMKLSTDISIHGKDFLPRTGELNVETIMHFFLHHFFIKNNSIIKEITKKEQVLEEILPLLPRREPTFCPGCQYRPVFYALKKVLQELEKENDLEFIHAGDIGCYTLAEAYPYQLLDWVVCMGAGIGIANGMSLAIDTEKQKLIAYIGDSTLFHSGLQPLLNAIKNNLDITLIIFNNFYTSMTGQQAHVSTPHELISHFGNYRKTDLKEINLEKLLKSLGIEHLNITDAYNIEKLERLFRSTLLKKGLKVIVIKEECALEKKRRLKKEAQDEREEYYTILDTCVKCNECIEYFGCPAINITFHEPENNTEMRSITNKENLTYYIDESKCISNVCPGTCKTVCKNNAIKKTIILRKKK